jgi:VCBS repeat-containing protein
MKRTSLNQAGKIPTHNEPQHRLQFVFSICSYLKNIIAQNALRLALLIAGVVLIQPQALAQSSMVKWSFGASNSPSSNVAINAGKLVTAVGQSSSAFATTGLGFPNEPIYICNNWNVGLGNAYWLINFSTTGYTSTSINFNLGTFQFGPKDFKMQYSTSSATGPWTDQGFTVAFGAVGASGVLNSYSQNLPAACDNQTNVWLRLVTTSAPSSTGGGIIDEVEILGTASNTAPTFTGGSPQSLTVCQDASATDIKGLLHVSDADASQTETWSQNSAPSHGTLSFSSATASSGSTNITPGGTITYTPTGGYSGSDAFTVQVSDGTATATTTINVTVTPTVGTPGFTLGATSTRCQAAGTVAYGASATNTTGITYTLDATSTGAGNSINASTGAVTYLAGWSGTSTITASAAGCNGPKTATHTVTVIANPTPSATGYYDVTNASGTAAYGAINVTTTSSGGGVFGGSCGITAPFGYNGTSLGAGSYTFSFSSPVTSVKMPVAINYSGSLQSVSISVNGSPYVLTSCNNIGLATTNCLGNTDPVVISGLGTITTAGATSSPSGIILINGSISTFTVNVPAGTYSVFGISIPVVNLAPVFVSSSPQVLTVCQNASATDIKGLLHVNDADAGQTETWSQQSAPSHGTLNFSSATASSGSTNITPGGTITYTPTAGYSGSDAFTVKVSDGSASANMVVNVTVTPTVGATSFTLGATSTRCQGAGAVTYGASATNTTGITYTLDGTSTTGGNSINASTGAVTYVAGWSGTSTITASAAGCNGPTTATHTVTITPTVGTPVFTAGAASARCQGAGTVTYGASASNTTGITYSLDGTSTTAGNSINSATGAVTYVAGWSGTSTITASAAGCSGPTTATHTVTVNALPNVSFTSSAATNTCKNASVTYTTQSGQSNYIWTASGVLNTDYSVISGSLGTSSNTVTLKWLTTGSKVVTVNYTNASSCTGASAASSTTLVNLFTWYQDNDGDGFGNNAVTQTSCTQPSGYVQNNNDCNDNSVNTTTWTTVGSAGFSTGVLSNSFASTVGIAIDNSGTPYMVYTDVGNSAKLEAMKYNGTSWVTVGSAGFSPTGSDFTDMAIDGSGTPYVIFRNGGTTVMKFNGTSWVTVGSAGFSPTNAVNERIAIDASGTPYIAYSANGGTGQATVMKFDGSNWTVVGNTDFSTGTAGSTSIAIDGSGSPYVVFADGSSSSKATVMKYNGTSWATVGSAGFSAGTAINTDIAIDRSGTPYVVYRDVSNSSKATVMKFNGTSWVGVGTAGFSAGQADNTRIKIDAGGTPYVTYKDGGNSSKATVMKFDGTNWVTVGSAGFSAGSVSNTNIALNAGGIPYVIYVDGGNSNKATVMKMTPVESATTTPTLSASVNPMCSGNNTNLSVTAGTLNDAANWQWYTGSCGGTAAGTGTSISVSPATTTTYYARGEGSCLTTPGSCGSVTVTVNQTPAVTTSTTASTCSGTGPNIALTASVPSTFAWTLGTNTGTITGASAASGATISQTLTNPSNATAGSIVYAVTPTSTTGSCVGAATNITVTVNPTPAVTNSSTASTCSGTGPNIALTASAASNFAWTLGTNTGAITGASAASGSTINQTLTNPSNATAGSIVYAVTPTSTTGSCVGAATNITVTVNPTPAVTTSTAASTCSGTGPNIALTASAASSFAWTLGTNTGAITGASAASGSTINQTLTDPSNATAGSIIYAVTPTSTTGSCVGAATNITVTVNPTPAVTTSTAASTCSGTGPNIALTASAASNFAWTLGTNTGTITGASAASGSTINQTLTNPSNATAGSIVYAVTPTSTTGSCVGAATNITVTVNPTPAVTNSSTASTCSGTGPNMALTASAASNFAWTLGTNTGAITGASAASGSTINQTLTNPSNATAGSIIYAVTPTSTTGSCVGAATNITVTVNPTPAVTTSTAASTCSGTSPNIALTATAASNFAWTLGTNTGAITGASAASGATINQTLANPSNATAGSIIYAVTPTSTTGSCAGAATNITVTVNPTPAVTTSTAASTCSGTGPNIALTATAASSFAWTLGTNTGSVTGASAGSGATINQTLTNPSSTVAGSIVYAVTPTSTTGSCVGAATNITVTVNPKPVLTNTTPSVCSGPATAISVSPSIASTLTWTVTTPGTITGSATGTAQASFIQTLTNPSSTTPANIVYSVTPTATVLGSCVGNATPVTVTVNPKPVLNSTTSSVCSGPATAITVNPSIASTLTWTVTTPGTITGSTTGTAQATFTQTLTNPSSTTPANIIYSVTPTATVLGSCAGDPTAVTVTVNPKPVLTNTTPSVCSGPATAIAVTPSIASTLTWTVTTPGTITGSTTGTAQASFTQTLTNPSSTTPANIVYSVTPTATVLGSCAGDPTSVTVTVNPKPVIGNVTRSVCNGVTTTMALAPSIASTYTWTIPTPGSITGGSTGTNQANFTQTLLNPSLSTPANSIYSITPTATVLGSCVGNPTLVTVTVNPIPTVNVVANQTVCNGAPTTTIVYSGLVSGTLYSWTNTTTSIGLAASGTGNINAFNGINVGTAPVTATVNVTPSANGCTGTPGSFTIRVNPTPTVNTPASQVLCHGINTTAVIFTGAVAGTTYAWTNNTPSINLAATGNGNIAAFTANNVGANPVTATISITPTANSCNGTIRTFTIRVNPLPVLSSPTTAPRICDSTIFNYTPTSATTGTSFAWNRQAIPGISNPAAAGINDPAEKLKNITTDTVLVPYTFTLNANGCSLASNVNVTVNPTPVFTSTLSDTICSEGQFVYTPASLTPGTTYIWSRPVVSGISPNAASGTGGVKEILLNNTTSPANVIYNYILTINNCSYGQNVNLLVNPTPALPVIAIKPPSSLCSGTMFQNFGAAGLPSTGASYQWDGKNSVVWTQNGNKQNALISFPSPGNAKVTLTSTIPSTGCKSSAEYDISVGTDGSPTVEVIYRNNRFVCLDNNVDKFVWGYDDKLTLDSTVIANATNQDYMNAAPDFTKYYYWVITVKNGCLQKSYYNMPSGVTKPEPKAYSLKAYPNPATDMINVEFDVKQGVSTEFRIYDMTGRLLKLVAATSERTQIETGLFAPGFYVINCVENGIQVATTKFIKQ